MIKNIYLQHLYCCKMNRPQWWRGSESKQHKSGQRHIPTQGHKFLIGALIREAAEMVVQKLMFQNCYILTAPANRKDIIFGSMQTCLIMWQMYQSMTDACTADSSVFFFSSIYQLCRCYTGCPPESTVYFWAVEFDDQYIRFSQVSKKQQ